MKNFLTAVVLTTASTVTLAEPTFLIGVSLTFKGDVGLTAKVLSTDENDEWSAAFGGTYYPFSEKKLGLDAGFGYSGMENSAGVISWDFMKNTFQASYGHSDLDQGH